MNAKQFVYVPGRGNVSCGNLFFNEGLYIKRKNKRMHGLRKRAILENKIWELHVSQQTRGNLL